MQEKSIQTPKHQLLAIKEILLASTGLLSFLNYAAACDYSALPERQLITSMPASRLWGALGIAHFYTEIVYLGGLWLGLSLSALLSLLVFSSQPVCREPKLKPACLHVAVGMARWKLFDETAF